MELKEIKLGAWTLIIVGVIFALKNIFNIDLNLNINWSYIWPIILIFWGVWIINKK